MSKTNASFGICRADKFIGGEGIFTTLTVGGVEISGVAAGVTQVNTSTGLTGGPITGIGTILLADTAVTPASYTNANITVDAQGRITAAANGVAGSPGVTQVNSGTGLTGGPITTTGTLSLANTAVVAGNYVAGNFTVDAQGRLTSAANGNVGVTSITAGTGLDGGVITTAGTIDLADTAVTPGSYTNMNATVDQQGRVTVASSGLSTPSTFRRASLLNPVNRMSAISGPGSWIDFADDPNGNWVGANSGGGGFRSMRSTDGGIIRVIATVRIIPQAALNMRIRVFVTSGGGKIAETLLQFTAATGNLTTDVATLVSRPFNYIPNDLITLDYLEEFGPSSVIFTPTAPQPKAFVTDILPTSASKRAFLTSSSLCGCI